MIHITILPRIFQRTSQSCFLWIIFTFDNKSNWQLDGINMGSLLGPLFTNAFLCHLEKHGLSDCPQSFCPKIFKRYVHNIFFTFKSHEQSKKFVEYMNTKHQNIKFIFKILIQQFFFIPGNQWCENDKLTNSVFRKSHLVELWLISRVLYQVYKFGLVYTLIHCSFNVASSYDKFYNEIVALKQIFKLNWYPIQFIDRFIKEFLQKILNYAYSRYYQ